jgi:hypothetical protein
LFADDGDGNDEDAKDECEKGEYGGCDLKDES